VQQVTDRLTAVPETTANFVIRVEPVFYEAPAEDHGVIEELAAPRLETPAVPGTEEILPPPPVKPSGSSWRDRRWRTWPVFAVSVGALAVGIVIGRATDSSSNNSASKVSADNGAASGQGDFGAQPSPGARADRTPTSAASPLATSPPTTLPGGHTVLLNVARHTGPLITDHFTVTTPRWFLGWAYDCTTQGGTGAFNITVFDGSGGPSKDGGIDQQGTKGNSVVAYTSTGERYLSVTTNCVWAVRVTT